MIDFHRANLPEISCLLVTGPNRLEFFKKSVQCYLDQTYPNLELIIINDSDPSYQSQLSEYIASLNRVDVRLELLKKRYTLGALRNISLAIMDGEVFVQWDDDDFNHPARVVTQFKHLSQSGKSCSFLSDQFHYYFDSKELFWEDWGSYLSGGLMKYKIIPGTVMGWRKDLSARYASGGAKSMRGEDSVFSNILNEQGKVSNLADKGYMHVYGYHGKNVWEYTHHRVLSKVRSHYIEQLLQKKARIIESLNYFKFEGPIRVMGRDGLAFIHAQ